MSWVCRMVTQQHAEDHQLQIGDMWYFDIKAPGAERSWMAMYNDHLSAHYFAVRGTRFPLFVWCPGNAAFCLDSQQIKSGKPIGGGWRVIGEAPAVTVSPSINIGGLYHGWLHLGVLSDDCEGRTYTEQGHVCQ